MNSKTYFDFCILGAGIAGFSIAGKLIERGASVCLIDTGDIASGASGTPLAMANPATGRYGNKVWNAEKCLNSITNDLELIQASSSDKFFKKTGILRPAQDEKMASRMKENSTDGWPEGWCTWLDKNEIHEINPELNCVQGGMWLPKGLTVNVVKYLKNKARYLQQKGLVLYTYATYSIGLDSSPFTISLDKGKISTEHIIYATGDKTSISEPWKYLPIHPVKGQIAIFESSKAEEFDYSISALGYIASISKNRFVAGSTYEHNFDHSNPDEEGLEYLIKRLGKVYPALFKGAVLLDQWAGVRASTPNKKPILGSHSQINKLYVFSGLGSKGMMYGNYMSSLLLDHILYGTKLPQEISVTRF